MRLLIVKPDNIGDFVLATGAIRLLIQEAGSQNVTLCVKPVLVPLACDQFPGVEVLPLPIAAKRKVVNLFLRNFSMCLPLMLRLRFSRFDVSVCLRSMRTYLETLVFLVPSARRFVANENILLRSGRKVRIAVERTVNHMRGMEVVTYPDEALPNVPLEIEAHRRVVERVLGRTVTVDDVMPVMTPPQESTASSKGDYWLCAPLTSGVKKNYPTAKWVKVFELLPKTLLPASLVMTGSADQQGQLEEFQRAVDAAGLPMKTEIILPEDLVAFVKVIAGAGLVLTGDTAAAHFATAMDRRALVLFSGMHTGMFGPWRRSERQEWLLPEDPSEKSKPKWHERILPSRAAETITRLLSV